MGAKRQNFQPEARQCLAKLTSKAARYSHAARQPGIAMQDHDWSCSAAPHPCYTTNKDEVEPVESGELLTRASMG